MAKKMPLENPSVSFEIIEEIAVISTSKNGWTKELNKVSWQGRPWKYDIREWEPSKERMSRGITLTQEELDALKDAMNKL